MSAESVPSDRLIGQILASRYEILHRLGEGAMGVVYKARHVKVGRTFAVKVLHARLLVDPKIAQRFEREAELAGRLRHANVVGVVDVGEVDGMHYMVMDFAEGPDLAQLLVEAPMPPVRIIRLVRQMLEGLYHAHEQGLIHRDFKPENVIIERDSHGAELVRIVDFGIALLREGGDSIDGQGRLTTNGLVLGTPHYMAPEQAVADPIDHRIDLFALGIVIYEMLSGRLPFDGSGAEVARANLLLDPPPISKRVPYIEVDPLLEAFARRLMAKQRDARPANANVARELLELIEHDRRAAGLVLGVSPELSVRSPAMTQPFARHDTRPATAEGTVRLRSTPASPSPSAGQAVSSGLSMPPDGPPDGPRATEAPVAAEPGAPSSASRSSRNERYHRAAPASAPAWPSPGGAPDDRAAAPAVSTSDAPPGAPHAPPAPPMLFSVRPWEAATQERDLVTEPPFATATPRRRAWIAGGVAAGLAGIVGVWLLARGGHDARRSEPHVELSSLSPPTAPVQPEALPSAIAPATTPPPSLPSATPPGEPMAPPPGSEPTAVKAELATKPRDRDPRVAIKRTPAREAKPHGSGVQLATTPKAVDTAPKAVDTAPKAIDTAPKAIDTGPKAVDTAPSKPPERTLAEPTPAKPGERKAAKAAPRCDAAPPSLAGISPNAVSALYYRVPDALGLLAPDKSQKLWGRWTRWNVQILMAAPQSERDEGAVALWQILNEAACLRDR